MNDDNSNSVYMQKSLNTHRSAEATDRKRASSLITTMNENEMLVDSARNKNTGSWLQRLMPDSTVQLAVQAENEELAVGFEYRRKALQLAVDSKLQAVEEACNHVLVTGKSEIRRERQEFFADQVSKLSMSMHEYAEEFNTEIDHRLEEIDFKYKSDIIRKKERTRLVRQIEDFHAVLEDMATEFQQIINEGVKAERELGTGGKR